MNKIRVHREKAESFPTRTRICRGNICHLCRATRLSASGSAWVPHPRFSQRRAAAHRKERPATLGIRVLPEDVAIHSAHIVCPCASGASFLDGPDQDVAHICFAQQIDTWSHSHLLRGAKEVCAGEAGDPAGFILSEMCWFRSEYTYVPQYFHTL
jgi:hypothetical protein